MSRPLLILVFLASLCSTVQAQRPQIPQSPRQALTEMFLSGSQSNFLKHLPDATKAALQKNSATAFSGNDFTAGLRAPGKTLQILEAGPILLSSEDQRSGEKFEIVIDRDDLMGDQDEMDLSFHSFKSGQEDSWSALYPKLSLKMALEGTVWKLKEIGLAVRLALDDPQFLKALTESMKQRMTASADATVTNSIYMLILAENRHKMAHPDRGFTCSLTELSNVRLGNTPNSAPIVDVALASGTKDKYKFAISGCGSAPVSSFQITAVPLDAGKNAFCADQSGLIKVSADGQATTCLSSGQPFGSTAHGTSVLVAPPAHER
ncbi:MAG: hypothetical protein DMG73_00190 [Acidobacteria bacterium]|nr:MAG: hypothetical protein DMG73_00190 [Acidobacteriota bacterium]PYX63211.1 MAG: hypothetical protein DMG74_17950 [Acidobacteriota bacterium]